MQITAIGPAKVITLTGVQRYAPVGCSAVMTSTGLLFVVPWKKLVKVLNMQ